ncbi:DUF4194 domain-containing protein [Klenkia sp. LSe6-5]|uniref:DUF4194 domain-containing protein n=1 Tax=Klenkia sesuvii TaxID=3103137 RepID=A0ABU8DSX1_9ACTN
MSAPRHSELDVPLVLTSLLRGVVEQDSHPQVWRHLQGAAPQVRERVADLGLDLVLDDVEGYAFLRAQPDQQLAELRAGRPALPRLVRRHALTYPVSLLLALLRKRLAEFDASSGEARLVLTREQVVDLVAVFLAGSGQEARVVQQVDSALGKVVDLGFVRKLPGADAGYEVRRILKAFVDGQWLADFEERLRAYLHGPDGPPQDAQPADDETTGGEGR